MNVSTKVALLFGWTLATGCLGDRQLRAAASRDMACPGEPRITVVDENSKLVECGGQTETYVRTCQSAAESSCTWARASSGTRISVTVDGSALATLAEALSESTDAEESSPEDTSEE